MKPEQINELIRKTYEEVFHEKYDLSNNISVQDNTNNKDIKKLFCDWCQAVIVYYDTEVDENLIMTDSEFDELQETLLNSGNQNIIDFINTRIYRNNSFEFKHYEQEMISLFKIKYKSKASIPEISKFLGNNHPILYYSPKFDGCSLKITFDNNGEILSIITRGGIDVTKQFIDVINIRECAKYKCKIITGELLISKNNFEINSFSDDYENPRNFVGGLVKKQNISKDIIKSLYFVPCTDGIDPLIGSRIVIDNLTTHFVWNILTPEILYGLETLITSYKSDDFPFLCDGIVIGYKEPNHVRNVKDNYPLNMVAIKFPAPRATTKIIGFEWTQKKSGKLTPKLKLDPVKLDGSTISYANGYNIEQVIQRGTGVGAIVEIEKSGDIIPIVVKVLKKSQNIIYPDCEYQRIGKHLIARNDEESIRFKFIKGLELLQIQGIGEVNAIKLGNVINFDILEVFNQTNKIKFLKVLEGSALWVKFSEVYNIKTLYLDELINILQFNNVGPKISKKVALLITKQSTDVQNISADVLYNVCRGQGFARIQEAIKRLSLYGIKILKPIQINDDTITYEMSGTPKINQINTKQDFEKQLKLIYPNAVHTTLSKTTKYLFVDSLGSNTSKTLKARKYNIRIVTYEDALKGKL